MANNLKTEKLIKIICETEFKRIKEKRKTLELIVDCQDKNTDTKMDAIAKNTAATIAEIKKLEHDIVAKSQQKIPPVLPPTQLETNQHTEAAFNLNLTLLLTGIVAVVLGGMAHYSLKINPWSLKLNSHLETKDFSPKSQPNFVKNSALSRHLTKDNFPKKITTKYGLLAIASPQKLSIIDLKKINTAEPETFYLNLNAKAISALAIAADRTVAFSDDRGIISIFNTQKESHLQIKFDVPITALVFDLNSERLIIGDERGFISIFSLELERQTARLFAHNSQINGLAIYQDKLVTASSKSIKVWQNWKLIKAFKSGSKISAFTVDRQGYIYTGDDRGVIRKWNFNGKELDTYSLNSQPIKSLQASYNYLAIENKDLTILNLKDRSMRQVFSDITLNSMTFSENQKYLFGAENDVTIWQNHTRSNH